MKRRARQVTIGAAGLVVAVLAGFVAAYWGPVRDHVKAWRFQLTRETETIEPAGVNPESKLRRGHFIHEHEPFYDAPTPWLCRLAQWSGNPVIFNRAEGSSREYFIVVPTEDEDTRRPSDILRILRENGWRVLEQRFPRRAYVVMRAANRRVEQPHFETLVIPGFPARRRDPHPLEEDRQDR